MDVATLAGIPVYNEELYAEGFPRAVEQLGESIRQADALMIATPEYNYSVPGPLKNAIDWVSRPPEQPFAGKPIAILGASAGGMGTARAQYHLRQVFVLLDGRLLSKPEVMIPSAFNVYDGDGNLQDDAVRDRIAQQVNALVDVARVAVAA